jgi:tRNA1Val (adenine37-N6)-methyltransferase
MPNDFFSFKKFTIYQDRCAMKVGTDGVLLGVLAPIAENVLTSENVSSENISSEKENSHYKILDIGTGTGLVAIMLAQRCLGRATVVGVEIDSDATTQARENADATDWDIQIYNSSIQLFTENNKEKFDLIVSNPPYFINSLKAPDKNRNTARHTDELSFEDLVDSAEKLLAENGRFTVIIPYSSEKDFINIADLKKMFAKSVVRVVPKVGKEAKRSVITFCKQEEDFNCNTNVTELVIETENRHCYTEEFKSLTADFYLKH